MERHQCFFAPMVLLAMSCASSGPTVKDSAPVDLSAGGAFVVIGLPDRAAYVIDPKTQSCFLVLPNQIGAGPVDCHQLKKKVAAAEAHVTWEKDDPMQAFFDRSMEATRRLLESGSGEVDEKNEEGPASFEGVVTKMGPDKWKIESATLADVLSNPTRFVRGARIVPSIRNGKPNGFKLYAVRPNSIFAALGIKNGDNVHAVNGHEFTTMDAALEVYNLVRDAKQLKVEITRRGKKVVNTYVIK